MPPKTVIIDDARWDYAIVQGHYKRHLDGSRRWIRGHTPVRVLTDQGTKTLPRSIKTMTLCPISNYYYFTDDAVKLYGSDFLICPYISGVVKLKEKWYFKEDLIRLEGAYYLPEKLVPTRKGFDLKKNVVKLQTEFYGDIYDSKSNCEFSQPHDGYIARADSSRVVDHNGNDYYMHYMHIKSEQTFQRPTGNMEPEICLPGTAPYFVYNSKYGFRCLAIDVAAMITLSRKLILSSGACTELRKSLNKQYDDAGADENNALTINSGYARKGGGIKYCTHDNTPIISATYRGTGGIRYTYGLEIETSAGLLTEADCDILNVERWGDRSISAYEYVTPPISGDAGLAYLSKLSGILAERTLINNECSIHIHVGGTNDPRIDSPIFNRMVVTSALKLGAMIEEDLFLIIPNRRRGISHNGHDASLRDYKDMNHENSNERLARFIFAHGSNEEIGLKLDSNHNKKSNVGRWNNARYRWLNLVHCSTESRMETMEIRIFPGTTNFHKLHMYILISLAFLWAAENKQPDIWKEHIISVEQLIMLAYEGKHTIISNLIAFIAERKIKFN